MLCQANAAWAACVLPQQAPLKQQLLAGSDSALSEQLLNQTLYLEPLVNGHRIGQQLLAVQLREGFLLAQRQALQKLGLPLNQACVGQDGSVALDNWPTVAYSYDAQAQAINFQLDPVLLLPSTVNASPSRFIEPQRSPGLALNYQVFAFQGLDESDQSGVSGLADLRAFAPGWGVLSHQQIFRQQSVRNSSQSLRLNTQWLWSKPYDMISAQAGDVISGGLSWARPVRLGGVKLARDFALQPNFLTSPGVNISGTAALPSTVEVYVNNIRQFETQVRPGPFQIQQLPVINGAGELSLQITDALGRQTVQQLSLYGARQLLRRGLLDFSFTAGYPRRNFGIESFDYANDLSASASARYGLAHNWTVEAQAEAGADFWTLGHGQSVALPYLGQLSGAAMYSQSHSKAGHRWLLAHDYFSPWLSTRLEWQGQSTEYQDLAGQTGSPGPRRQQLASVSIPLANRTSIGSSYLRSNLNAAASISNTEQKVETLALFVNHRIGNAAGLIFNAQRNLNNDDYLINLGLSWRFGARRSLYTSYSQSANSQIASLSARQNLPLDGRAWGWDAGFSGGDRQRISAGVSHRSRVLLSELRAEQFDDNEQISANLQGAASLIGGRLLATTSIFDSFALVSTGVAGVPILRENRVVGTTDENGDLLVPRLSSNQENQLALDPMQIAAGYAIPVTQTKVVPATFSGIVVDMPIRAEHAAIIQLQQPNGSPVPVGATVYLNGERREHPVGYDGIAYVSRLRPDNHLMTRWNGSRCSIDFTFSATPGTLPTMGPLTCQLRSAH